MTYTSQVRVPEEQEAPTPRLITAPRLSALSPPQLPERGWPLLTKVTKLLGYPFVDLREEGTKWDFPGTSVEPPRASPA